MIRRVREVVLVALVACGGKAPPPAKPKPPDPKLIAADLERDMAELAALAARLRDDCPALIEGLRPLIARMKAHAEEAKKLQPDPALGKQLQDEVHKYDEQARGRADQIGENLGAAYLKCPAKEDLRRQVDQIPTFPTW